MGRCASRRLHASRKRRNHAARSGPRSSTSTLPRATVRTPKVCNSVQYSAMPREGDNFMYAMSQHGSGSVVLFLVGISRSTECRQSKGNRRTKHCSECDAPGCHIQFQRRRNGPCWRTGRLCRSIVSIAIQTVRINSRHCAQERQQRRIVVHTNQSRNVLCWTVECIIPV